MKEVIENLRENVKQLKLEKIERLKNFKALKFWCIKTKQKVFEFGFKGNVERVNKKRQYGLQILLFQENRASELLLKQVIKDLINYTKYRSQKKNLYQ